MNKEYLISITSYIFDFIYLNKLRKDDTEVGELFSFLGPANYSGDILNSPNLLWSEDEWTDERIQAVETKLKLQGGTSLSTFWKKQYIENAGRYWHDFYKRNSDHFYKDRHYLHIVFPELDNNTTSIEKIHLLEVGCGVGNSILPLLKINPNIIITAIDFAKSAIEHLYEHPIVIETKRITAIQCNVVKDDLPVTDQTVDLILCMFVLSAIHPQALPDVLRKLHTALKVGGKLLMRDYGRYDEAQLRFTPKSKVDDHLYVRQDGTLSYFFELEAFRSLAIIAGFSVEELYYIRRQYANRLDRKARYRVWIHSKLIKLK